MKKLSLLIGSVLLLYCLIELFFRLWFPHTTYSVTYAKWGWKHRANTTTVYYGEVPKWGWGQKGVEVKYHWDGLRTYDDIEVDFYISVLCLGDSWLEDMGSDYNNLVTTYLGRLLPYPSQATNAGHYGFNNTQELMWYEREGTKYLSDIVLLFWADDQASGEYITKDGVLKYKTFNWKQKTYRNIVSFIRLRSHFGGWLLNRLNKSRPLKKYLIKEGYKETDKPIVDATHISGKHFKPIDGLIYKRLNESIEKDGGVLIMINCLGLWSPLQKEFLDENNIRYMDLDFDVIAKNRAQKEIDIKEGVYRRELDSDRFGYKNNEAVSQMIVEYLKREGLI